MKFNFDLPIPGYPDGKINLKTEAGVDDATYKQVIGAYLLTPGSISQEEKWENYLLAEKIREGGEVDLDAQEITRILNLAGKHAPTLIFGRIKQYLDITEK